MRHKHPESWRRLALPECMKAEPQVRRTYLDVQVSLLSVTGYQYVYFFSQAAKGCPGNVKDPICACLYSKAVLGAADKGLFVGMGFAIYDMVDAVQH